MYKNWRAWFLIALLIGPFAVYIGFGALWLKERGWLIRSSLIWVALGVAFQYLASRWTKSKRQIMPPIDWDVPETFLPHDQKAWELVQEEAKQGETIPMEQLSEFDVYIETGRRLARRLAAHYYPLSTDPIEHVAVVDLLTALELAADDLNALIREVPGGDLVTPAHWKRAVQVSGYIQKANDIYSYLYPIFQPMVGVPRLIARQAMVQPAWKSMQQNLMRWFFAAFVNRLGTHLVELYSGRLSIGADQYRRLTRKVARAVEADHEPLTVAVAGSRNSGKSRLVAALEAARSGDLGPVRLKLQAAGLDPALADRLKLLRLVEVPGYVSRPGEETARERATRRDAVEAAGDADLLILVIDAARADDADDAEFARAWERWFVEHPGRDRPPALAALVGVDCPEYGGDWKPPYQWAQGRSPREVAVRARLDALRTVLAPSLTEVVAVGLAEGAPFGVVEGLLPAIASLLHRADRAHLLRIIHRQRNRSKAGRFISQVGQQGRRLWNRRRQTG